MTEAENKVSHHWSKNEGWLFQKFKTNDTKGVDCSTSQYPKHVNQWFNITFDKGKNMTSGDEYLAVTFIENQCGKKMNLRFQKFDIPALISNGKGINTEMCNMLPGRNFLAIKQINFDDSDRGLEEKEKYQKALAMLKDSFDMQKISQGAAICVQGQAQELFYGSKTIHDTSGNIKNLYPDGWIIMTYVNNYTAFGDLKPNPLERNISVAAMMDKEGFQIFSHKVALLNQATKFEIPPRLAHGLLILMTSKMLHYHIRIKIVSFYIRPSQIESMLQK